jgi:REP element-mobilizing transposase RayT
MAEPLRSRIQVFDRNQEHSVVERCLPHWSQAGTIAFLTWRSWDSIPQHVLEAWLAERAAWLRRHGIDPASDDWRSRLAALGPAQLQAFQLHVSDRWNEQLDICHGACVLRRPDLSQIVVDSLLCFDGDRYELTDFVVMPNHVHLLAAFPDEDSMLRQCDSWKHFTATKINRILRRKGRFWQQDGFDHLVRSPDQFEHFRHYIAENPRRAQLDPTEFRHMSKPV